VDKGWMNPFRWCQGSTRTIDRGQFGSSDHFANSGFVSLEVEDQTLGVAKSRVARREEEIQTVGSKSWENHQI
jgi:hypothetical protein